MCLQQASFPPESDPSPPPDPLCPVKLVSCGSSLSLSPTTVAIFPPSISRSSVSTQDKRGNRIFYLSIPPSIFTDVARCASQAASAREGWTRVIVEKPFGKDSESFNELSKELYESLTEDQMYRIDHYLGKELIENLTVGGTHWTPSPHQFLRTYPYELSVSMERRPPCLLCRWVPIRLGAR